MEIRKFVRKPFAVEAVRVTAENIEEVAAWCGGDIRLGEARKPGKQEKYVKVPAHRPINVKQTQAYIGDWVLSADTGFKVYTNGALERSFGEDSGERNLFNDLEELRTIDAPPESPEPEEKVEEVQVQFLEPESPTQSNFFGRNQQL